MKSQKSVIGFLTMAIAAVLGIVFVSAATLPTTGILSKIEQSVIFVTLVAFYHLDGCFAKKRKRPLLRISISALTVFLTCRYLNWRLTQTLPFGFGIINLVLGIALVLAELHGIISAIMGQIINVKPLDRTSADPPISETALPTVDVLIPTYNEDPSLVETTVIAATQLDYPAGRYRVYILDDGGTNAKLSNPGAQGRIARERASLLRDIANTYGAIYLTRTENSHAKAGNLNNALQQIHGKLILILDCDHVPTTDFLKRTVGFFAQDPKLFLLQTPHNFITPDPIERNLATFLKMPAENELFYTVMQPGLDFWGASFFCGSAALLRRRVLDEIGGISGKSITEDAETTVKAMCRGYRTAFYNRPMVSGLQPETFTGFILQRVRWAQGMLQIFILDNIWLKSGLTFMQKILFTNFAFYWLFPISRAILLIMPPLFLFFGFNVAVTTPQQLLLYAVPYYLAAMINSQYFYGRVRWPFISQVYETAQTVFLLSGIVSVIRNPSKPTFKVTPKGEVLDDDFISHMAWPFYALLGLAIASLGVGIWRITEQPQLRWALIFVTIWVILDVAALLGVIGSLAEKKQIRRMPRIYRNEPVWIRADGSPWHRTCTCNLSRFGAALPLPAEIAHLCVGSMVEILFVGQSSAISGQIRHVNKNDAKKTIAGIEYRLDTSKDSRQVIDAAFGSSDSLVRVANRRHRGANLGYAFAFLVKIGIVGAIRHLCVLSVNLTRRGREFWKRRTMISILTARAMRHSSGSAD